MDVVVTVPKHLWQDWLGEGDLPGQPWSGATSHFWISSFFLPKIQAGERVYIVAHGKLRGYAPLARLESCCTIDSMRACLLRGGGAVAVTLPCGTTAYPPNRLGDLGTKGGGLFFPITCLYHDLQHPRMPIGNCPNPARIQGFQGWRYRWWSREDEVPFPDFQKVGGITAGRHQPQCREAV